MSETEVGSEAHSGDPLEHAAPAVLALRAAIGGVLMGLANLVPGVSGGTMLLAAGVYPAFIGAIALLSTLRLRWRPILIVGTVAAAAAVAILLLAGLMRSLVTEQRWIMYSLFIGLTLGGVPLVWRMASPASGRLFAAGGLSFAAMVWMAIGSAGGGQGERSALLLFASGLAGASAMILPGVSGGYLLLLLGQYERILGAIDDMKRALLDSPGSIDVPLLLSAFGVVIPVGLGVVLGVIGVSNLLRWLLARFEKPTLGALLGLLLGAVVGLWPFQEPVPPTPGTTIEGVLVTAENAGDFEPSDWPTARFTPAGGQVAAALALILVGFASTVLIDRVGIASSSSSGEP